MTPTEWIKDICANRGLDAPGQRHLYRYRVTAEEYRALRDVLRLSARFGFENAININKWDAAFVMYAAGWWMREYAGNFSWEPIFTSIGIDHAPQAMARTSLIESGLAHWRLSIRRNPETGHRLVLGTIASEGGLPLHHMAEGGGWLKKVLPAVVKKHRKFGNSLLVLVESYQDLIPESYQSPAISQVLEDIARELSSLIQAHELETRENPVRWLDEHAPDWRSALPFPIERGEVTRLSTNWSLAQQLPMHWILTKILLFVSAA